MRTSDVIRSHCVNGVWFELLSIFLSSLAKVNQQILKVSLMNLLNSSLNCYRPEKSAIKSTIITAQPMQQLRGSKYLPECETCNIFHAVSETCGFPIQETVQVTRSPTGGIYSHSPSSLPLFPDRPAAAAAAS